MIWKISKVLWFGMYARLRDFIWLQGCVIYYGTLRDVIVTKNVVCLPVFFKFPEISTISFKFQFIQYNKIVWTKFFISTVTVLSFQVPGRISSTARASCTHSTVQIQTSWVKTGQYTKWMLRPLLLKFMCAVSLRTYLKAINVWNCKDYNGYFGKM